MITRPCSECEKTRIGWTANGPWHRVTCFVCSYAPSDLLIPPLTGFAKPHDDLTTFMKGGE